MGEGNTSLSGETMPTIIMLTSAAGDDFAYRKGQRVHVTEEFAKSMITAGYAKYSQPEPKPAARPKRKRKPRVDNG
jgi:hypothetical protein